MMRCSRFRAGVRLFVLLVGLLAAATMAAPAEAATIQVNNPVPGTGGTGDCTLQEAIQAANTDTAVDGCTAGSGADTILFCNCTITLTAPFQVDATDGPIGLPDITSDITIKGLGPALSIIERLDPGPDFSIFRVLAGGVLQLESLRLRQGRNVTGGAIINRGMTVVRFAEVNDSVATGGVGMGGGAIANFSPGTLTIDGSTLDNNSATAGPGGAIRNESTLNIVSSTFSNNTAATIGGAIDTFVLGAPVTIDFSVFFDNTAVSFGGAVHHHQSPLTVTNSLFFTNTAGSFTVMQAGGGAIEGFGPWIISDSTFDGNLTFSFNVAHGGALRYIGDSLMVSGSTFTNNVAQTAGGGIEINGPPSPNIRVVNSTFSQNRANGTGGGGINVLTGSMELNNVTMTLNFGVAGGGILVQTGAASFITRNSILAANDTEMIANEDCFTQAPAVLTSQGHNLIGIADGCTIVAMGAGDLLGTSAAPLNPQLVPLQDNGGPTMTHALRPGSPAVNAGDLGAPGTGGTTCEATDQRGVGRPAGLACDIGAFEGTLAQADLALTGMDAPDPVNFNSNVTFTFTITNNGPNTAPDVTLFHSLGLGFDAVSAIPTQGTCNINQPSSGDEILCDIGSMANGAMVTVTVVATAIQAGFVPTFSFVRSSMVDDPNLGNNAPNLSTLVLRNGDLRLTTFGPLSVQRGANFTYSILVENLGGAAATNVTVVDTLPAGVTFVSSNPAVCNAAGSMVTCNLPMIPASPNVLGLINNAFFTMTVTAPATPGVTLMNSATVSAAEADPDASNNTQTFQTNVVGNASLLVTKTDSPDPVPAGSNLTYTITVMNNGPDPATSVTLTETTPFGAVFVSINPAQGNCTAGPNPVCDLGTINSGASVVVTFVVRADVPCVLDNTVFVTSPDAPPASASATTAVGPPASCVTFDNDSGDGQWNTATNWSTDMVPGAADCVVIPAGQTATYTTGAQMVSSLQVDGTLNVAGGTLTATAAFANSGAVNVNGGTLRANGSGTSSGSFAVFPGAILEFGGGTQTLTAASSVAGTGNGTALFTGATLDVNGSYNIPTNISGGTVNFNSAATAIGMFFSGGTLGGTGVLTINTTLQWSGGSMVGPGTTIDDGFSSIGGDVILNGRTFTTNNFLCWCGGTINVGNGAVWNVTGTFDIQSDGSMIFNQGGANLQINNSGTFQKTQSGVGTTVVEAVLNNTGNVAVNAGTLLLRGGGNCGGTCNGSWSVGSGSTLRFVDSNFDLSGSITGPGNLALTTASGTNTFNLSGPYNVTGSTTISRGIVSFTGSVTGTGFLSSNGNLSFTGGLSGLGDTTITGGSADFSNTEGVLTFPSLSLVGVITGAGTWTITGDLAVSGPSVLDSSGDITINGLFTWSGGQLRGSGTVFALGGILMNAGLNKILFTRTLENAGSFVWTAPPPNFFILGSPAVFLNRAGATVDIRTDSDFFGDGTISNLGTFQKTVGAGATDIPMAIAFNNSGTVAANSGILNFQGPYTQTAGSTVLNGGGISAAMGLNINGGTLSGNGTVTGAVANNGGMVSPGLSPGTLNITGNYTQGAAGALNIELMGTAAGQFDVLAITGMAMLDGTLNVSSFGGFTPMSGQSFQVMTFGSRAGDFGMKNNLTGSAVPMMTTPGTTDYVVSFQAVASADLAVTKTDSPDPVQAGGTLTYSITVSNGGPDPATNVTLTDVLPAGINFVSAMASQGACMQGSGTVTCNLGSLAASASATVSIDVRPTAAAVGSVSNTASVTAAETDPNPADNSATTPTTVVGPTLLGPTPYLSQNDSPFLAGILSGVVALETFEDGRLDVPGVMANNGAPIAPSGITDSVDGDDGAIDGSGTAGRSFFSGNGAAGITFTFNAAALGGLPTQVGIVWTDGGGTTTFEAFDAAGASLGVIGPVSIADGAISGTTGEDNFFGVMHAGGISAIRISNTAGGIEVDHLQFGPVPTPVNADLVLTKMDSPDPVTAGSNLTYTLTVMNAGVGAAAGVTVTDTLPAGTMFVSATPSVGMCVGTTTVSCNLGSLGTGATETVTIVVTPAAGPLNNTASVSSTSNELFVFNNSASAATAVTPVADLQLMKTDSPDPVAATANLTYTLTVTNLGPSTATGIVVTDTLPAAVNFVSASAGCMAAGGTVTCNIASLASGANAALSIVVTPQAAAAGTTITNMATVTANEADPNANNNSAAADTAVVAAMADVQLTKADAPDPVTINAALTYTLTVRNNGPQSATSVVLTDTLPAGVAFGSATAPCTQAMGIVTCNLGTLASGAQTVITITVTPGAPLGGTSITNNASVTAAEPDPNAGNNMASATTAVSAVPFTISAPSPASLTIPSGAPATFTFNVTPTTPGIAVAISCGSPLPPDTTCTVVPPSILFSNTNPQPVTVTLQTTICLLRLPPRAGPRFPDGDPRLIWPLLLALSLLFWTKVARRNEQLKRWTPVFALVVFALLLGACANGQGGPAVRRTGPIGTLPGNYVVPVNVTSGTSAQSVTLNLTVN